MVIIMLIRIKKMQFIVGCCMILQIVFSSIWIPFHFIAMLLSIIIILWQRKFCVLQIHYHYYILLLYIYRLFILMILTYPFFEMLYLIFTLYVGIILILLSMKTFL